MKDAPVSVCPVPPEQRPINEYQQLAESWFFSWVTLAQRHYFTKLMGVWCWSWLIAGPVAAASFVPLKVPVQFFLCGAAGASVILILVLLRLYLGWFYIRSRLENPVVFYEESGWYDGQSWSKTPEVIAQDQLIVTYQIQPILRRLRQTFYGLALLHLIGGLIWWQA